ncbi:MAG: ABC transporter substrate-binding protein [Bacteroidota bacterium]
MTSKSSYIISLFVVIYLFAGCGSQDPAGTVDNTAPKAPTNSEIEIVSLSGFLTEVLYTLGHGENIVGRDVTSTYPEAVNQIANLGHISQLNTEAILALAPDFIFLEEGQSSEAGNIEKLTNAGIKVVKVPTHFGFNNALTAANEISKHLEVKEETMGSLEEKITVDSLALINILESVSQTPSVLFVYARGTGRLMVGGKNTSVAAMIEKAGGKNAIQEFDNYRALTPESLIKASPDIILMFTSGLQSLDGKEGLKQISGMSQTPAYINGRIIAMDGHYLASFGPRSAAAANELALLMHN